MSAEQPEPGPDAAPDAALDAAVTRLEQALDHLASRATAARALLDATAGGAPLASHDDIAALADRLEQTLARLRAAADVDAREPQGD